MDYKKKYKKIPRGYKHEVLTLSGCVKSDIFNWEKGHIKKVGVDKVKRITKAIQQVWQPHNLVSLMTVNMGKNRIVVDHPTATNYIKYNDLMSFKIDITGTIGNHETVYELVDSAYSEINKLWNENPYEIDLLIAKKIIHDNEKSKEDQS